MFHSMECFGRTHMKQGYQRLPYLPRSANQVIRLTYHRDRQVFQGMNRKTWSILLGKKPRTRKRKRYVVALSTTWLPRVYVALVPRLFRPNLHSAAADQTWYCTWGLTVIEFLVVRSITALWSHMHVETRVAGSPCRVLSNLVNYMGHEGEIWIQLHLSSGHRHIKLSVKGYITRNLTKTASFSCAD